MNPEEISKKVNDRLRKLYDRILPELVQDILPEMEAIKPGLKPIPEKWSEKDCYLITYGDSIISQTKNPLATLIYFLNNFIGDAVSHVHILPFFPSTSDDGFSITDYREVNPLLGTWDDITQIGKDYTLMFDLVINHISQQSAWFKNYLKGTDHGKDYFIEIGPDTDLSAVVRPRSLPLLTAFKTDKGTKHIWTTFSSDQVDLNFANPQVLIEILRVFLFYIAKGARTIRLDAIAFLWKQIGTSCLHLPQTHEIVKLMRDIKDYLDPGIVLITETNVPNNENLSYFGDGDEADIVYQFSLPPLLLHTLFSGTSFFLNQWAASISKIPEGCTFFNFTASHDGIGLRPLEGLLPNEEIIKLTNAMKNAGGYISTKRNSDGTDTAYEMNITYLDALKYTKLGADKLQVERFICSQTIMMAFRGVPAFYIHSLLGTTNDFEGVQKTGMQRSINRRKWNSEDLFPLLNSNSINAIILKEILRRITIRKKEKAFHPEAPQHILALGNDIFGFSRGYDKELIVLANLQPAAISIKLADIDSSITGACNLLANNNDICKVIKMDPYQVIWLKNKGR